MAKTSYVVVLDPAYDFIEAYNPEEAIEKYKKKNNKANDVAIVPRNAFKLNGKRIPFFNSVS